MLTALLLALQVTESSAVQRSLLLLSSLQQQVNLGYGYDSYTSESDSRTSSSSQHRFDENYSMGIRYIIYDPRLLTGTFSGTIGLHQEQTGDGQANNNNGSGQNFQYRVGGTLLKKDFPITFYSFSQLDRVQRTFAPTYELNSDGFGVALSLQNKFFPTSLSYSRNTSATNGQGVDTTSTSDAFSVSASHSYRDIVQNMLTFSRNSIQTDIGSAAKGTISIEGFQLGLSNGIDFHAAHGRSLHSRYLLQEQTGSQQRRSSEWTEALLWGFGEALTGGANYANIYENINSQKTISNSGSIWLQHRLFQSLTTGINLDASRSDFTNGDITSTGGSVSLNYVKSLRRESTLQLGFNQSYSISDNTLAGDVLYVVNERQTVPDLITVFEIPLAKPDIVHDSITVRNQGGSFKYTEGADYTVRQNGLSTYLVFPAVPQPGLFPITASAILSIDYQYKVNPSIRYASSSRSATANLSLFGNRYRIFANYAESSQEALSGRQNAARLYGNRNYSLNFTTRLEHASFGGEYRRNESTISSSNEMAAFWRYAGNFDATYLSIGLRDNITFSGNDGMTAGKNYSNAFSMSGSLQRLLLEVINMRITGQYVNLTGQLESNYMTVGVDFDTYFGKTEVSLQSSTYWRFEATSEQENSIRLNLRRQF